MSLPVFMTDFLDSSLEAIYSLQPYLEPTVVLVPDFVTEQIAALADAIGFDVPTCSFTLALFAGYPLGLIMAGLPYGPVRHFFSLLLGAFMLQLTTGVQWIHQLITSLVVYGMFLVLPRKVNRILVPVFLMSYCVLGHLHRQYINYLGWDLDFTGAQMVITQKLYMMAYNLYDGQVLAQGKEERASKKCKQFALEKVPDLLSFLGYTFCFSTVLAGPAYEFSTYQQACDGSLMLDSNGKPKGTPPSNFWPTLKPFLTSLLNMGVFVFVSTNFPLLDTIDPKNNTPVVLTEEFLANPWIYRYMYTWVGLIGIRQKYYFAWKNAEGSNNIWYAGFEGFDEKGNAKGFENANNMDIIAFETAPDTQTLTRQWNKKTSLWLTRYVYIRTGGSLIAVYSMSAFWHGFYPGYYMFFLSVPLMTFCDRIAKKRLSPYFPKGKWSFPYGIASIIATSFVVEYMITPFVFLAADRSWAVYKSNYFFGHILCVVFYIFVSTFVPKPKKKEA
eukprot:CAMPEP_0194026006 /NCGR_PEP_ID=MMETSP0009_2-20130614/321_1 /TAXON_ID=210454 /ORGANISM="Grammatophora oceanica, Strain CCMP 410" /LENGTH=500 /DNA_ID=CAMNT_0038664459 /DNA_START=73 /DNA_END=1575 /DNA_ORIENTATION=-